MELKPSLKEIHDRLFPVGEPTVDQVVPTPLYELPVSEPEAYPFKLTQQMQSLLNVRAEIAQKVHTLKPGVAGQIVCIETLMFPALLSGKANLPSPVFVLLDDPISPEVSNVWNGWIVSPDTDYMTEFDVLLNDGALREDSCQFVQTWNNVIVHLHCAHRVAGIISKPLLNNIRRLSVEFELGIDDEAMLLKAGISRDLVKRQLKTGQVYTGTLLHEENSCDPRNEYVGMYGRYATLVTTAIFDILNINHDSVVHVDNDYASLVDNAIYAELCERISKV